MSDILLYILNSAAWSVGGLFVGFFLGRTGREVHEIKQTLDEDKSDDREG